MELKVKRLHKNAIMPTYATDGSGAFDLYALVDKTDAAAVVVSPGLPVIFRTGLSFEIPEGHAMFILSRSGHGFKSDVRLANCVGLIDSDYRDEVMVKLTYDNGRGEGFFVENGNRIAQALILPLPKISFCEVDDLSVTARAGGFGSTGN